MHHPTPKSLLLTLLCVLSGLSTTEAVTDPLETFTALPMTPGFTVPTSETASGTASPIFSSDSGSGPIITLPTETLPSSTATTSTESIGSSVTSVSGDTATAAQPSATATASLSGVASSAGASATASAGASGAAAGRGRGEGSTAALVVALGMGVAGLMGL